MKQEEDSSVLARAIGKAVRRLVPFLALMYILAFLDRANVGFAKQAFQADTGLSNAAYAFGAGIFFIGYALFEVPSNVLMFKVGARRWLARIMVTWGLLSAAMMFAHTDSLFYVLRFLLGASEAGFVPGVMLYLTYWFPLNVRAKVCGYFWFGPPLAFVFGGPLSGALLSMDGVAGLQDWQLMFLIEGLLATFVGIWALFYLNDRASDAKCTWLDAAEKRVLLQAVEQEDREKSDHGPRGAWSALVDLRVLYLCLIAFTIQIGSYGVTFFLPSQVAALLGTKIGLMVGVLSAIPWLCATIAAYVIPHISTRTGERRIAASITLMVGALGVAVSGFAAGTPVVAFIALCMACAGLLAVQPIFWTFPTGYLGGAAAASGIALINSLGNLGGFVAPNIRVWAEGYFQSTTIGLYLLAAIAFIGCLLILALDKVGVLRPPVKRLDAKASLLTA